MSLIEDYCVETVTITPQAVDKFGRPSHTGQTTVTTKARVIEKQKKEYRPDGAVIVYDKIFLLKPTETVAHGYRITHGGVNHEVVDIKTGKGLSGEVDHYKVMVRVR